MKKRIIVIVDLLFIVSMWISANMYAQKIALIDMEYLSKNISAYEVVNEQLKTISKKWQEEIEIIQKEVQNMYRTYQMDLVFLSPEMKKKRESEIVAKEQEIQELKKKYFGTKGELFKKRESLIEPIQNEIYNAVKEIATAKGYLVVIDKAVSIYVATQIDISKEILAKIGDNLK